MKRTIICLLTVFLLSTSSALAQTVREQVVAPERISETYTSNTGRTTITLDACVSVPDAAEMYLIPVTAKAFDDAMVSSLAELIWPGLGGRKIEVGEGNETASLEGVMMKGFWRHHASVIRRATPKDDIHVQVNNTYLKLKDMDGVYGCSLTANIQYDTRYRLKQTINYDNPYMHDKVTGEGIEGHPLTSAQAVEIAQTLLRTLNDEPFVPFAVGQAPGIIHDDERILAGTEDQGTGYSYALAFAHEVEGAPLLPCYYQSMSTHSWRDDLYTLPVGYEQILMAINREGRITNFMWSDPYTLGDAREAQRLMPFEQILSVAQQVMPLKYQWKEAHGGEISIRITDVALGYMALLQRDKLSFALTPIWNFYGNIEDSAEQSRSGVLPLFTVNAVDGTVADLEYGY